MCCLFGIVDPQHALSGFEKNRILHVLATAAEARGTDATGFAYHNASGIQIHKNPIPGHKMFFHIGSNVSTVIGHTRMATQGDEHQNRNNHPFYGHTEDGSFALAHNGVIYNDITLRQTLSLPQTRIETDSYIAVQLLQSKNTLDFQSLKYMAEQLSGSFTFTVLNDREDLYIVKGDNPLCLIHYPKLGIYLYASTPEILQAALLRVHFLKENPKRVDLECGEILKISRVGDLTRSSFNTAELCSRFSMFGAYYPDRAKKKSSGEKEYLAILRDIAISFGYMPETVDQMVSCGFSPEEIEEYFYEGMYEN